MTEDDSQRQQRALLDNIPDMAWLKDRDCRYLAVNTAYLDIVGRPEAAVLGRRPDEIWPREISDVYLRTDRAVLKSGRRRRYEEARPDGKGDLRWFDTIKSPIRDANGRIIGTVGISRDISERKMAEGELIRSRAQLRELTNYLQSIREEERARISRELHDELGQTLTALKMELGWLRDRMPAAPELPRLRVDRLMSIVDQAVVDLRRIAADLRPLILDELGLVLAVQWLAQSLSGRHADLALTLSFDREDLAYSDEVSTAAFRIVQEALTNIIRHSRARRAAIGVRHEAGELRLEIRDDGRGMDLRASWPGRLGLAGMAERARMLGGSLAVDSAPGAGTTVRVRLPLKPSRPTREAQR
ncbi:Signal transduction histidine-protein kinase/phosphatase DegS [bacterium YEK0313]|nr:Signal transduction histidine-protein kinase/phosphatase DegS [bacterium YEK0313]